MAGQHLEQAQVVRVELVETELRHDDHADNGGPVAQRHRQQRLLDARRAGDPEADAAVRRVTGQERLARERHVARDTLADARLEHVHRRPGRREVAPEGDRAQIVAVADEDATVVVVDQQPELVGDRRADLRDVVQPAQLRRDAVQHLQVRDRAELGARASGLSAGRSRPSSWKTTMRPFPRAFAVIIATSAQATSSRGFAACSGPAAIPTETVTGPTRANSVSAICSWRRSASGRRRSGCCSAR